ncbi:MAG: hypothetical protein QW166_03640, partial [Candidatus Bathyarchaeia archaeon]
QRRKILEFYVLWRDEWKKPQTRFEIPSPRIRHFSGVWGGAMASLSRSLRQLEAKKLIICCSPAPKQSYATHYHITEKGECVLRAINQLTL